MRVAGRLGLGDLGRDPLLRRTGRGQELRGPRVSENALGGPDVGIDRLAHDRMRELEALGTAKDRERHEHVGRARRLGD